jgi:hypothetical protein
MIQPAAFDGNLQLATVETAPDAFYGVPAPPAVPVRDLKMLARFDDGLDLDEADGLVVSPLADRNITDVSDLARGQLATSVLGSSRLNTLYPDGKYSELGRSPAYYDRGNADGFHGVISFWAKNNFSSASVALLRGRQYVKWTNFTQGICSASSPDQFFFLGYVGSQNTPTGPPTPRPGICVFLQFDLGHEASDTNYERMLMTQGGTVLDARRWTLFTAYYDFHAPRTPRQDAFRLSIDDGTGIYGQGINEFYATQNSPWMAADITLSDMNGPHILVLGRRGADANEGGGSGFIRVPVDQRVGKAADATLDEFAIYDFGGAEYLTGTSDSNPAAPETLLAASRLASDRYREGRYYREDYYEDFGSGNNRAAQYLSPRVAIPEGSLLRRVEWTWRRPAALPDDYVEIELVDVPASGYLWGSGSRSTQRRGWGPARQDWEVGRVVHDPFRARVVFRRLTPLDPNAPLLDSPVFDDLGFLYAPPEGPRVMDFGEGE